MVVQQTTVSKQLAETIRSANPGLMMINFGSIPPDKLTKEDILRYVDSREIYEYYTGKKVVERKAISSPLRPDKNPSFSYYPDQTGEWKWIDHGRKNVSGDFVDFIRICLNVGYREALNIVYTDLVLKRANNKGEPKKDDYVLFQSWLEQRARETEEKIHGSVKKTTIGILKQAYTPKDASYWTDKYGIDFDVLHKFNVHSCKKVYFNANNYPIPYYLDNPVYAFEFPTVMGKHHYKIYRPLAPMRADRWRSNCDAFDVFGLKQLPKGGNVLILTKSLKDVMVFHTMGLCAVAPQSEGSSDIPEVIMEDLKLRFRYIIVNFDNDETGKAAAIRYCDKYDLPYTVRIELNNFNPNEVKDISDLVEKSGHLFAKGWFFKQLESLIPEKPSYFTTVYV